MPRQYTPRVALICAHCAEPFSVPAYRAESAKFCRRTCKDDAQRVPLTERFWSEVIKCEPCWLVPIRDGGGYGHIGINDRPGKQRLILSHVLAWEIATGEQVPEGRIVCHTCDVRNCVRNDEPGIYTVAGIALPRFGHLWLGTPKLNMIDMAEKGRAGIAPLARLYG